MTENLFPELIQFSWTISALVFAGQGWIFLQEFKGNRIFKCKHLPLLVAFIANVVAAISLFILFDLVMNESLKETRNYVAESIKLARTVHTYSLSISFVLSILAVFTWIFTKNQRTGKHE